jgi:Domain of unknown function (DUF1844)
MTEQEKSFVLKEDEKAGAHEKARQEADAVGAGRKTQLPNVDFATFIFSLNSAVLVHLGVIEEPGTGAKIKNLDLAKQTIDILGMLEEKTRGNLSPDEEQMLKNILYDLRIHYVRETG